VTVASSVLLSFAGVLALVDWAAVARNWAAVEYAAKPAATLAFLGAAATLDVPHGAQWALLMAALVCCAAGDVFLLLPRDAFVPGLASFAVAQVLFTASFASGGLAAWRLVAGAAVVVPVAALLARRFVAALRRGGRGALVAPVVVYLVVISAMAIASVGAGRPVAIVGAVAFMVSDSFIAESRFVAARRGFPVAIMATYHVALAGLVLGLA
jgi:uncharacterized membrane protein YhhN